MSVIGCHPGQSETRVHARDKESGAGDGVRVNTGTSVTESTRSRLEEERTVHLVLSGSHDHRVCIT